MKQWYIRNPDGGSIHGPYDTPDDANLDAEQMGGDFEIFSKGEPVVVHKITHGFVNQRYEDGVCVEQSFTAGDECEFEDDDGNPLEDYDASKDNLYQMYDMVQPEK